MKRNFTLILAFCASFLFAQKIKIVDSETSSPISDARIIFDNKIYYTNDEGFSLLPDASKDLDISAYGYETLSKQKAESIIKLKPRYNSIDEVKIVSIDFQKILKEVLRKYDDVYYNNPAIYDVTIKQKSSENNNLKLLMIADGKFWNRDGHYNAKEAYNDKFDNFVQLQIDHLRYLKTAPHERKLYEKKNSNVT